MALIQRKNKDLMNLKDTVTPLTEDSYLLVLPDAKLKITFPAEYPFKKPHLELIEPYECDCNNAIWSPATILNSFIESNKSIVMAEGRKILANIPDGLRIRLPEGKNRENFLAKAYLVLGSSPYEKKDDRTHYYDPTIFLLDIIGAPTTRYLHIDFSSPTQLGILSSLIPNNFDEICFDWSTLKFFKFDYTEKNKSFMHDDTNSGTKLLERLIYLKKMLKPGGKIYFENINGPPGGGKDPDDKSDYGELFKDYCARAGFKIIERSETDVLPPILFIGDKVSPEVLVAQKIDGGGAKKRRLKTRNVKRKFKLNRTKLNK